MIYRSILSFIPSIILGYLIVDFIWHTNIKGQSVLKLFLGVGIGLGTTSLLLFLWLWLTNQIKGFEWLLTGIILAGILLKIYLSRNQLFRYQFPTIRFAPNWLSTLVSIAFVSSLLLSYSSFIAYSLTHQHGDRDAQAIWNLHARIIYRDPANWKEVFSPEFDSRFHPDYPLLIPLDVVWGWHVLNTESTRIPIVLSGFFLFGMAGLLVTSLSILKTWGQGVLSSLVLMGTPYFILLGTFQTADVPFAYFVLSVTTLFAIYTIEKNSEFLILTGLAVGISAWTKNEGDLLIVASMTGCVLYGLWQKQLWKTIRPFLTGLLVPALIILSYKITLAPSNDLFASFNTTVLIGKLLSLQRYATIFSAIGTTSLKFGGWPLSILILLAIFFVIVGREPERFSKSAVGTAIVILVIQLIGYIFVYVITPLPLEFHLQYSLDRLLFQLFPSALFLFFWTTPAPENIIQHLASASQIRDQNATDN